MDRAVRLAVLLGVVLLWPTSEASACSCVAEVPLCESFWSTPVVFEGEVLAVDAIPHPNTPRHFRHRLARFRVDRVWRGALGDTAEVRTGAGGGDCGYAFRKGTKYLVYAYERGGSLTTGICSRTRPLSRAGEDLEYLKNAFEPSEGGRIFGRVTFSRTAPRTSERAAPGYTVVLASGLRRWTTTTGDDGRYEFLALPVGSYQISVETAEGERAWGGATLGHLELTDPRACASARFVIERQPSSPSTALRR